MDLLFVKAVGEQLISLSTQSIIAQKQDSPPAEEKAGSKNKIGFWRILGKDKGQGKRDQQKHQERGEMGRRHF
jgi:hypothetical protein